MAKRKHKHRKAKHGSSRLVASSQPSDATTSASSHRPRFTVAMATYNRAEWVGDAIESVLTQSFMDFEYVIVDDGSQDNTPAVIRSYNDQRIKFVAKPANEGRPATRNRIVAESCGEYILWMADDDRLAPGILARYDLELAQNPSIDVIYGNLAVFGSSEDQIDTVYEPRDWASNPKGLLGAKLMGSVLPDPGTATRLEIVQSLDYVYDSEFLRAQDYELWTRIAHRITTHKVEAPIYFYRQHEESASFGDFVDTTFESKIIRAHRARHTGRELAPDLNWSNPLQSEAELNLRIAQSLNQYGDGVNALRFCRAIPQSRFEPLVIKERVKAMCLQGRVDDALLDIAGARRAQGLNDDFAELEHQVGLLSYFHNLTSGDLTGDISQDLAERLKQAHKTWGWTYDLVRVFGHIRRNQGDLKKAALAYAYAARLNLLDRECVNALVEIRGALTISPGKIDFQAMRRRISEQFVELSVADSQPKPFDGHRVSILDVHYEHPQTLCEMLSGQDVSQFELVGFYRDNGGYENVNAVARPADFGAQIQALMAASNGGWIVFAEPNMRLYPNFLSEIMALDPKKALTVQTLTCHRPHPEDDASSLSFMDDFSLDELYSGQAQWMHRFAWSADFKEEASFTGGIVQLGNLGALRLWLSSFALLSAEKSVHVGATMRLEQLPSIPQVNDLLQFYRRYQNKTTFHRKVRVAQNQHLAPYHLHFLNRGRVTVAHFLGDDEQVNMDGITQVNEHTYAPYRPVVVGNMPSENSKALLRAFRDERKDLGTVLNSRAVVPNKLFNQALCRIGSDVVALIDASAKVSHCWLSKGLWHFRDDDELGMICCPSSEAGQYDLRCMLIRRAVLEQVGGLRLDIGFVEAATDFLARVKGAGFLIKTFESNLIEFGPEASSGPLSALHRMNPSSHAKSEPLFHAYAAELGYQPETVPVQLLDKRGSVLLAFPQWDDQMALSGWLGELNVANDWQVFLRCDVQSGDKCRDKLEKILAQMPQHAHTEFFIVDAPLAPEREAGLLMAADAVFVDKAWSNAQVWVNRALDCGCAVFTQIRQLNDMMGHGA